MTPVERLAERLWDAAHPRDQWRRWSETAEPDDADRYRAEATQVFGFLAADPDLIVTDRESLARALAAEAYGVNDWQRGIAEYTRDHYRRVADAVIAHVRGADAA